MRRQWSTSLPFRLCLLVGLILLGLGALITLAPELGERAFGLGEHSDGFQRVAGVRTSYLGLVVLLLAVVRERRALGILLTSLALNPLADFLIVLTSPSSSFWDAAVHLPGMVITMALGVYLLKSRSAKVRVTCSR